MCLDEQAFQREVQPPNILASPLWSFKKMQKTKKKKKITSEIVLLSASVKRSFLVSVDRR